MHRHRCYHWERAHLRPRGVAPVPALRDLTSTSLTRFKLSALAAPWCSRALRDQGSLRFLRKHAKLHRNKIHGPESFDVSYSPLRNLFLHLYIAEGSIIKKTKNYFVKVLRGE